MKKLLLVSCFLFTPSVFAADQACTFNLVFIDSVWNPFKTWTVIITDNTPSTADQHNELVGAPSLWTGLYSDIQKGGKPPTTETPFTLTITVDKCTNSTQLGLFAHANPNSSVAADAQAPSNVAGMQAQKIQAWSPNYLLGMAPCVGDMGGVTSPITINVGNPANQGASPYFVWGGGGGAIGSGFTKQQLGVTCKNPATEQGNTGN